jgi:hypothetical protein
MAKTCSNCGYEFPPEVDIGSGQKSRMGSFSSTCPICNRETDPPKDAPQAKPGFRPGREDPSFGNKGARPYVPGKKKKRR